MNPLDEIDQVLSKIASREKKGAEARGQRDLQLHREWIESGKKPEKLQPLLQRFEPFVNSKTRQLSGGALLNDDATRLHVVNAVVKAFETYDPTRGAGLNTHVQNRAMGVLRKVIKAQNIAAIPEEDALQIGKIDREKARLEEDLGRAPTHQELAGSLGMSTDRVKRIQNRRVRDLSSGGFEVSVTQATSARDREILPFVRDRLTPFDQKVFDLIYEKGIRKPGDITRHLGVSPADTSRAITRIQNIYKEHLLRMDEIDAVSERLRAAFRGLDLSQKEMGLALLAFGLAACRTSQVSEQEIRYMVSLHLEDGSC